MNSRIEGITSTIEYPLVLLFFAGAGLTAYTTGYMTFEIKPIRPLMGVGSFLGIMWMITAVVIGWGRFKVKQVVLTSNLAKMDNATHALFGQIELEEVLRGLKAIAKEALITSVKVGMLQHEYKVSSSDGPAVAKALTHKEKEFMEQRERFWGVCALLERLYGFERPASIRECAEMDAAEMASILKASCER